MKTEVIVIDLLLLDASKAFDRVEHLNLLITLHDQNL